MSEKPCFKGFYLSYIGLGNLALSLTKARLYSYQDSKGQLKIKEDSNAEKISMTARCGSFQDPASHPFEAPDDLSETAVHDGLNKDLNSLLKN